MPVTRSGLFSQTWVNDLLSVHDINLDLETNKCALFKSTITPDFTVAAASARYGAGAFVTGGEASGTGYTAGGKAVTGTTVTVSDPGQFLSYQVTDPTQWTGITVTDIRCGLFYVPTITTPNANPAFFLMDFGGTYNTNGGTLTITWPAAGLFRWRLNPA